MGKYSLTVDLKREKNKAFVYVKKKEKFQVTEKDLRTRLSQDNFSFGKLHFSNGSLFIFDISEIKKSTREVAVESLQKEEVKITDLIESYGASELPPAPAEITDPEPEEEKPKPTRRRRTRRKTTKTAESSE